MRTTVTLDDDVGARVQELAHRERTSFKRVLNALVRRSLDAYDNPAANDAPFVVHPRRGGFRPGVDPLKLNQLVDQIETDDFTVESAK